MAGFGEGTFGLGTFGNGGWIITASDSAAPADAISSTAILHDGNTDPATISDASVVAFVGALQAMGSDTTTIVDVARTIGGWSSIPG